MEWSSRIRGNAALMRTLRPRSEKLNLAGDNDLRDFAVLLGKCLEKEIRVE